MIPLLNSDGKNICKAILLIIIIMKLMKWAFM